MNGQYYDAPMDCSQSKLNFFVSVTNPNGGPPQTLRLEGKMGDVLYDASSPYQMVGQERFTNFLYGKPPGAGGDIVGESPALEV